MFCHRMWPLPPWPASLSLPSPSMIPAFTVVKNRWLFSRCLGCGNGAASLPGITSPDEVTRFGFCIPP
eukprot:scaffold3912_cov80-Cyclotella_meneghiniana.AAC.10